ncbi:MAG: hypothetical protein M1837_006822 [Sclerophora amabilis]|nr:MAG: hypothetical protein M1837_006822 [Sclerophora amabilis]
MVSSSPFTLATMRYLRAEAHALIQQAQTPTQRRANEKYARQESAKRGKPESVTKQKPKTKSPISPVWIGLLAFVIAGGIIFELMKLFF